MLFLLPVPQMSRGCVPGMLAPGSWFLSWVLWLRSPLRGLKNRGQSLQEVGEDMFPLLLAASGI